MPSKVERIKTDYANLLPFVNNVQNSEYQIPTFQRDLTWKKDNIKKLWDSIFKFYPIGSFLIWKTDVELHQHRNIGGHIFKNPKNSQFSYILDGQQRATSILLSLRGFKGAVARDKDFDPILYVDLSIGITKDDNWQYQQLFLFWDEIDDRDGKIKRNTPRKDRFDQGIIVKLVDLYDRTGELDEALNEKGFQYKSTERENLRNYDLILKTYVLSFIVLQGIEVREVCEIFERINQEGIPLDIYDIVVAKTYRNPTKINKGFYLRDLFGGLKEKLDGSQYRNLPDFVILQILGSVVMQLKGTNVHNITNTYLPLIKTEEIEKVWKEAEGAIIKSVQFLEQRLHLIGPNLVPYSYMYPVLTNYFFQNKKPDFALLKKWFWYISFDQEDFDSTSKMRAEIKWLDDSKSTAPEWPVLTIDKNMIRSQTYFAKGARSRAILAFMASQKPCDFEDSDRDVLQKVYLQLTDKPNLHHFFPSAHLEEHPDQKKFKNDPNSLINIVYLTMLENLQISDKNPLTYVKEFVHKNSRFSEVLVKHMIPNEILDWAESKKTTWASYDDFVDLRLELILSKIKDVMGPVKVKIIDSSNG